LFADGGEMILSRLKRWLSRLGSVRLFYKIAIPFVAVNIVTALIAGPIAKGWVVTRIEQVANEKMRQAQNIITKTIKDAEKNINIKAKVIAENPLVSQAFIQKERTNLLQALAPLKSSFKLSSLAMLNQKGTVILSIGDIAREGQNLANFTPFKQGMTGLNIAYLNQNIYGKPILLSVNPIRSEQGIIGVLMVSEPFTPLLYQIREKYSYDTLAVVNQRRIVKPTLKVINLSKIDRSIYQDVIREGKTRIAIIGSDRDPYRAIYFPLKLHGENVGLVAAFVSDKDAAYSKHAILRNIFSLNLLLLLIMMAIGYIIARGITKPVESLVSASKDIAEGKMVERVTVPFRDEIGELADSFSKMAKSIRDRDTELKRKIRELSVLYDVSVGLGNALDLGKILKLVAGKVAQLFQAKFAYIAVIESQTEKIEIAEWFTKDEELLDEKVLAAQKMVKRVLEDGQLIIHDGKIGQEVLPIAGRMAGFKVALALPLKAEDELVGALTIFDNSIRRFSKHEITLLATIASEAVMAVQKARLFNDLQETYLSTVRSLATAVDAKDPYTRNHSQQVAKYALLLASELGLSESEKLALETAAYLHDIGKIGVSDKILLKENGLTKSEMEAIKQHSLIGANILAPVPFPWEITPAVRHHHERYGGEGYPGGLIGKEIPLMARILAIADAFDAMTSERPYRKAKAVEDALAELRRCAGNQFDPELVRRFEKAIRETLIKEESLAAVKPLKIDRERQMLRSAFTALAESVFWQYRQFGGVKVASSLEAALNEFLSSNNYPVKVSKGHFKIEIDGDRLFEEELAIFKDILKEEISTIEKVAGSRTVRGFRIVALNNLEANLRQVALTYELFPRQSVHA
jgi:putative nucleotidyltransferase with HDIG domain